ncbi:MAG: DNA polymerase III subunit alpha, partial [Acidobacteria bacterium]|nr:DNA polymerase III subunit alpha [Acidobacteriota bacterium]
KGEYVAQMAKKDIAKVGILKMDFLGLANLTILAKAVKNVKRYRGIDLDIGSIPLTDSKTFEMLGKGDTNGVFQLESAGMRRNVVELKPASVRELAAIVALYRPGPMAEIPKYVRSKFSQEPISYLHPDLKPILEETYGVICFQEQVLRIARAIGGFSMGQADVLRKAMSSKNRATMDKQREKFVEGARNNGVSEKVAVKIYELIEPFAGYAFNKAHAVCYALLAYRTAYMKANYPVEYYAALLSANMDDKDKLSAYIEDCKRLGTRLLPPDVNHSGVEFEVEDGAIRFGLGAIKGCGRSVIESMVAAREAGGKFKDLFDFCERAPDSAAINKSTVECLIRVGAFSSLCSNRAQLLAMLPDAMNSAAAKLRDHKSGQSGLFGFDDAVTPQSLGSGRYSHISEFRREDIFAMEKELVGLYLSGHPLEKMRASLGESCTVNAISFKELENDQECSVGGIISDVRFRTTRRNDKMAFIRIEDLYGSIPVTFFPAALKSCEEQLKKDAIVLVKGRASHRERIAGDDDDAVVEVEIRGESVTPLKSAARKPGKNGSRAVHIKIEGDPSTRLDLLRAMIEAHPGESPVYFWMLHCGSRLKVATQFKVDPSNGFVSDIERILGRDAVKVA